MGKEGGGAWGEFHDEGWFGIFVLKEKFLDFFVLEEAK